MNNESLREDAQIGAQAKEVIENEAYQKAWRRLHDNAMTRLLECEAKDDEGRYLAWVEVRVMRMLNGSLNELMAQGESASKALDSLAEKRERITRGRL